jgi:hypothetical protein
MSLLKTIAGEFDTKEKESQIQREKDRLLSLVKSFIHSAMNLIWSYSPDVMINNYSIKYSYPYLDPGTTRIPSVDFVMGGNNIPVYVEAELIATKEIGVHPHTVRVKRISVVFDNGESKETVTVEQDDNHNLIHETLPTETDLMTGIRVLDYIEQQHKKLKTQRAPQGHSD